MMKNIFDEYNCYFPLILLRVIEFSFLFNFFFRLLQCNRDTVWQCGFCWITRFFSTTLPRTLPSEEYIFICCSGMWVKVKKNISCLYWSTCFQEYQVILSAYLLSRRGNAFVSLMDLIILKANWIRPTAIICVAILHCCQQNVEEKRLLMCFLQVIHVFWTSCIINIFKNSRYFEEIFRLNDSCLLKEFQNTHEKFRKCNDKRKYFVYIYN